MENMPLTKKIWITPKIEIIAQEISTKSNPSAREASYVNVAGSLWQNPKHATLIPKASVSGYIS